MIDIVFPNKNEKEFIKIAEKLDYISLCFVYPIKKFKIQKNEKLKIKSKFKIKYGVLTNEKNINKAKTLSNLIFIEAKENTRHIIERNKNIIIFDFEKNNKKDFIHQRRSGLNHIMCNLAVKNNVKVGISFNSLLNSTGQERNISIGRISSNVKLCRKFKTKIIVGSFASNPFEMRSKNDLKTFFSTIGLHPSEVSSI